MTDAEVAALTPPEVAELTMDQLAALTPSQVAALTMAQLAVLTPAQISALLPEQVAGLTLAQLAALTPAQIADLLAVARGARADEDLLPLTGYKPNYFLHTEHRVEPQDRLKRELKFQISAKKALWGEWAWFGYTQKAFWQLYDDDANDGNAYDSGEFRELNFNPEIFFVVGPLADFRIQFSPLDHESNGAGSDTSRSLFRSYVQGIFDRGTYKLSLKLRKYRKLDQNPTLEDFLGKWEANFEGGSGPCASSWPDGRGKKTTRARCGPTSALEPDSSRSCSSQRLIPACSFTSSIFPAMEKASSTSTGGLTGWESASYCDEGALHIAIGQEAVASAVCGKSLSQQPEAGCMV